MVSGGLKSTLKDFRWSQINAEINSNQLKSTLRDFGWSKINAEINSNQR